MDTDERTRTRTRTHTERQAKTHARSPPPKKNFSLALTHFRACLPLCVCLRDFVRACVRAHRLRQDFKPRIYVSDADFAIMTQASKGSRALVRARLHSSSFSRTHALEGTRVSGRAALHCKLAAGRQGKWERGMRRAPHHCPSRS